MKPFTSANVTGFIIESIPRMIFIAAYGKKENDGWQRSKTHMEERDNHARTVVSSGFREAYKRFRSGRFSLGCGQAGNSHIKSPLETSQEVA
ncbi:hypothetical protein ASB65_23780 [Agrobacterium tumefaciens str. B6]|nr:hypothetical protein ASB65_23780 [Agrobacterium tumefaciens str. B6]MQB26099.1 hypothetical protein [Agrobacterium tumefaciens]OCJ27402.1 hypothetical protein A6U90_17530 [Agrobacterium tumefaciens]